MPLKTVMFCWNGTAGKLGSEESTKGSCSSRCDRHGPW